MNDSGQSRDAQFWRNDAAALEQFQAEFIARWQAVQLPSIHDLLARVAPKQRDALQESLLSIAKDQISLRWKAEDTAPDADSSEQVDQGEGRQVFDSTINLSLDTVDFSQSDSAGPLKLPSGPRFRILQEHAKGGLGQVSIARDQELDRDVALKEIQEQFADDPNSRRRFVTEAKVTGQLEHPGIVPVYGFGVDASGRPYYAMRLIKGDSLKEAIDRFHGSESGPDFNSLEFRQLLNRFVDVCNAVQYAHSRNVLHRDIKPANVMLGDFGETLLVDWGLAKVMQSDLGDEGLDESESVSSGDSLETGAGAKVGTPAYMSPEQARGHQAEIGQASDIYSLGATLYHLMTGHAPVGGKDVEEVLNNVEASRYPTPREAQPRIPKPLDALCRKAMSLVADDRYASASAVADDVERWLADEPVAAYPETLPTRLWRWVKRHQSQALSGAAAVLIAIVCLAIVLGVVANSNGKLNAKNRELDEKNTELTETNVKLAVAEKEASEERDIAIAINDFVREDLLGQASPDEEPDRDVKLRTVIDRAAASVARRFEGRPRHEAAISMTIGGTYFALGEFDLAERYVVRARDLASQHLGEHEPDALLASHRLAMIYYSQGRYGEAVSLSEVVVDATLRALGQDHPATWNAMDNLAASLMRLGRHDEAAKLYERLQGLMDRTGSRDRDAEQAILNSIANLYHSQGRYKEALDLYMQTLNDVVADHGEEHPDSARIMVNLAGIYESMGRHHEGLSYARQALRISERILGEQHPDTISILNRTATLQTAAGRPVQAVKMFEQVLEYRQSEYGENHQGTLSSMNNLAELYRSVGRYEEALSLFDRALEVQTRLHGKDHSHRLVMLGNLSSLYQSLDRFEEALPPAKESLEGHLRIWGDKHVDTLTSMHNLAMIYDALGRHEEAETLHSQSLSGYRTVLGDEHDATLVAMIGLASHYRQTKRADQAIELLNQTLEISRRAQGEEHPTTLGCMNDLAGCLELADRHVEAEPIFRQVLDVRRKVMGDNHPDTLTSIINLAQNLRATGRVFESIPLYEESIEISRRMLGENHVQTSAMMFNLAGAFEKTNQLTKALDWYRSTLRIDRATFGDKNPQTWTTMRYVAALYEKTGQHALAQDLRREIVDRSRDVTDDMLQFAGDLAKLASILLQLQKYSEAEQICRECLAIRAKELGDHWLTFNAQRMLGQSLAGQMVFDEAESELMAAYASIKTLGEPISPVATLRRVQIHQHFINLYDAWDKPDEAAKWRAEMAELKRELGIVERPEAGVRPPGPRSEPANR